MRRTCQDGNLHRGNQISGESLTASAEVALAKAAENEACDALMVFGRFLSPIGEVFGDQASACYCRLCSGMCFLRQINEELLRTKAIAVTAGSGAAWRADA